MDHYQHMKAHEHELPRLCNAWDMSFRGCLNCGWRYPDRASPPPAATEEPAGADPETRQDRVQPTNAPFGD